MADECESPALRVIDYAGDEPLPPLWQRVVAWTLVGMAGAVVLCVVGVVMLGVCLYFFGGMDA
jgi:hypothetical protein